MRSQSVRRQKSEIRSQNSQTKLGTSNAKPLEGVRSVGAVKGD
jgi:hypothetical protein